MSLTIVGNVALDLPEPLLDRIAEAIMKRSTAGSGMAVFVDPVVIKDIIRKELAKGVA